MTDAISSEPSGRAHDLEKRDVDVIWRITFSLLAAAAGLCESGPSLAVSANCLGTQEDVR
jgi:hypothetical protein